MLHKFSIRLTVVALAAFADSPLCHAQSVFWSAVQSSRRDAPTIEVSEFETWALDVGNLEAYLAKAPAGKAFDAKASTFVLDLPMPDGRLERFSVVNSPVMAPGLARRFPEIQVFAGQGIDSPEATVRFDLTPQGFHGMILGEGETVYIDPYHPGERELVIAYTRSSFYKSTSKRTKECEALTHVGFNGHTKEDTPRQRMKEVKVMGGMPSQSKRAENGVDLRTYRLALACTGEYAQFHGGTVSNVLAAMNTSMARVNAIYERDVCLTMEIIANNDEVIFLNGSSDPYSNGNGSAMLSQNINTCNSIIGEDNYDIGHVYSTGGGGVALLRSPCDDNRKAGGVTGQASPVGDPFDVDYVAHEMGHQYGGNHTQNNGCNRASSAAFEPGSASTIMGYAGICPPNLQNNSDDHFHNHSINEMISFTVNGAGGLCAAKTATGNSVPIVSVGSNDLVVPISTPLELTATASDSDGDALTYNWEEYDLGPATTPGDNDLTNPSGNQPIFRSFSSTSSPTRTLPRMQDLVNNTTSRGEFLPDYSREIRFKCSVRDNRAGGGGFADGLKTMAVTADAGPFLVQSPNGGDTVTGNSQLPISWDVAGTNGNGVNCSAVDIFLSTDGGYTFPILLLGGTPNDGSATVSLPNLSTSNARIKVKASNNVFFDISNENFSIELGPLVNHDLAITGFQDLDLEVCQGVFDPTIRVTNFGVQSATSFNVNVALDGGEPQVIEWAGTLDSGESVEVQTCQVGACSALEDGAHFAEASVELIGVADEVVFNNTVGTSFASSSGVELTWVILTDNWPNETTWSVANDAGNVVWTGGPYETGSTTYSESMTLPCGCYSLTVLDSFGDGICCEEGQGSYTIESTGGVLVSGGQFGSTTTSNFCVDIPFIGGCADPNACNYNPEANANDGTCIFPDSFTTSCGTCTYDCDGTCLADADGDGICDTCECPGCQDEAACNYDATATDPGACFYPDPGFNCDGTSLCLEDLNGNGAIEVGDVLEVLSEFGCDVNCTADVTGDGFVAVDDVLTVLSLFGEDCN